MEATRLWAEILIKATEKDPESYPVCNSILTLTEPNTGRPADLTIAGENHPQKGAPMEVLDDGWSSKTIRDYVCAVCWSALERVPAPDRLWKVQCAKHGEAHSGFVTKTFTNVQRTQSRLDKVEAERNLRKAGVIPTPAKRSEAEILDELGF